MTNTIDNSQDTIDSREIIDRIEELEAERESLEDYLSDCKDANEFHNSENEENAPEIFDLAKAIEELKAWDTENAEELNALKALAEEAENSPDWIYGETLIREDYFVEYIEQLISECYEMPKEINSGSWPYRHITIDYEAAAEEAKQDYLEVDFDGVTYLIRA